MGGIDQTWRAAGTLSIRALAHALASVVLAAGLHHATTDSRLSLPSLLGGVVVAVLPAAWALRPSAGPAALMASAAAYGALSLWLEATSIAVPAGRLDGHLRLPPAWHHNALVMACLNMVAAYGLMALMRSIRRLPHQVTVAGAALPSTLWTWLPRLVALVLAVGCLRPLTLVARPRRRTAHLPRLPLHLIVLHHRSQPCAP